MADAATDTPSSVPGTTSDVFGGLDVDKLVRGAMPTQRVDEPKVIAGLQEAGKQEAAAKEPIYQKLFKADEENLKRVHAAADGIQPVDLKQWDAKKAAKENTTDPMEQFGSLGFIAVQLASAFTRRPMVNSLNGAAAFMEAVHTKDQTGYERAYKEWKDNTELAIKRHNIQREAYEDAAKRFSTDHGAYMSEMEALTAKFGDKRRQALMDGGYVEEIEKMDRANQQAYMGILRTVPEIEKSHAQRSAYQHELETGKNPTEAYKEIYAPASSTAMGNFLGGLMRAAADKAATEASERGEDPQKAAVDAAAAVKAKFNPGKAATAVNVDADDVIKNLTNDDIHLPPELNTLIRGTLTDKASSQVAGARKSALVNALEEIRAQKESGDKPMDSAKAGQIIRDALDAANSGKTKIDQAIVNQFPQYDGMNAKKFGYVGVKNQERIMNAVQSSEQIEHIASYAAENPEAIGLVADAARKINVDAYHGLIANPTAYITKLTQVRDSAIDEAAKAKGLSTDQAAKAKVLNKMLATQAFADAAQAGSRGATIYLDKAFREIYQQASSPPAFFDILRVRQADSDNFLSKYDMGLKARKDVAEKFPFYENPQSYLRKAVTSKTAAKAATRETGKSYPSQTPDPAYPIWGGDGKWYSKEEWETKHGGK